MNKKDMWQESVMMRVSREVRAKIKVEAIKKGVSINEYLKQILIKK